MTGFEYLTVLVSIVVGLGLSHLLASTARLIQRRDQVRWHAPALLWIALLFVLLVQIWWAGYEARGDSEWNFVDFLSRLAVPLCATLVCYVAIPDLDRGDAPTIDLRESFHRNRPWFFGLLAAAVVFSLGRDLVEDGREAIDLDAGFRAAFLLLALVAARVRSDAYHLANALLTMVLVAGYIATLFATLR